MTPLSAYLILSTFLFAIGLAGALTRRNAIMVLIGIELMLNAANLNFIAFARQSGSVSGQAFALFVMGFAAAEVAVGLALVVALYRKLTTVQAHDINLLKG